MPFYNWSQQDTVEMVLLMHSVGSRYRARNHMVQFSPLHELPGFLLCSVILFHCHLLFECANWFYSNNQDLTENLTKKSNFCLTWHRAVWAPSVRLLVLVLENTEHVEWYANCCVSNEFRNNAKCPCE